MRLFALLSLAATLTLHAQVWTQGTVEKVSDGDTFRMLANGQIVKVRLYGIDAPESKQDFGPQSKAALTGLVLGKNVKVKITDTDRYGRSIGELWIGDTLDVNLWMVRNGYAWWYKAYGKMRPDLEAAQNQARSSKRGLWTASSPQEPWEWRSEKRSAQASKKGKKNKKSK